MSGLFGDLPTQVSLDEQLAAVKREIGYRRHVYPRLVAEGKKSKAACDKDIALMEAVLATLTKLKDAS